ncbi:MAG: universal stress protein [Thermoflexibacter sp.]|nr:universal stress protein [Thermoflexibacter sp.]
MNTLQKILVPTDFSPESIQGLSMAVGLASKTSAKVYLLHVIDIPTPKDIDELEITHLDMLTEKDLQNPEKIYLMKLLKETKIKINELKKQFPEANISDHVSFDRITHQINYFVEKYQIHLIVMGSKGMNKNDSFLLGSNAEKVIRTAKVPVLTVKREVKDVNIKHICFASDFKQVPITAIEVIKKIQKIYQTTIHLVKIITPNNFELSSVTRNTIKQFAEEYALDNYTINFYNYYTEYEGILSFAQEMNVDMIVMTTQGNTGLIRVLMGSIAEDVAYIKY